MSTIVECHTVEDQELGKIRTVYIEVQHIRAIWKLDNCYSVIYGSGEGDYAHIGTHSFDKIMACMEYIG
jgi:hypothetical protein